MKASRTTRLTTNESRSNPRGSRGRTMVNSTLAAVRSTMTIPIPKSRELTTSISLAGKAEHLGHAVVPARREPTIHRQGMAGDE